MSQELQGMNTWGVRLLAVALLISGGCSQSGSEPGKPAETAAASAPDARYLLTAKPEQAQEVGAAVEGTEEDVTVVGLIGGSADPFVADVAAFTIVDTAIPYCSDDEGCPTPWDYCCKTNELKGNTALVKIVGDDGAPVSRDARSLLGVKELSKVTVTGKAKRDESGNLTILAQKVHVAQE